MPARIPGLAVLVATCCLALSVPAAQAAHPQKMAVCSYQVADLVVPLGTAVAATGGETAQLPPTLEDRLIKLLVQTIQPASWAENGGPGTIEYHPLSLALVINQTLEVHEQVADLLQSLRRMQDLEVALEVRVLTVGDDFGERLGIDFNTQSNPTEGLGVQTPDAGGKPNLGLQFLNDQQVRLLMELVQGDQRANVLQAPKVTLFNGQPGTINATDTQYYLTGLDVDSTSGQVVIRPRNEPITTGFRMMAQPVVSADRRFVQLYLKVEQTDLASAVVPLMPVTVSVEDSAGKVVPCPQLLQQPKFTTLGVEKTVAIPDGGTVVFGGMKKMVETRNEYGPPILSEIPYVNRLFKNVGYGREAQQVFVLVTPRIIVKEEEEVKAPAQREREQAQNLDAVRLDPMIPAVYLEPNQLKSEELGPKEHKAPAKPAKSRQEKVLAKLRKAYDEACAEGRGDEAEKFARAALAIDPTCFCRKR